MLSNLISIALEKEELYHGINEENLDKVASWRELTTVELHVLQDLARLVDELTARAFPGAFFVFASDAGPRA